MKIVLLPVNDDDFRWFLGEGAPSRTGLLLAAGGVDDVAVIRHVREIARRMRQKNEFGSWMMVADIDVVGMCGLHDGPDDDGIVEIGYSVAASCRRRGYATAAIARMIAAVGGDPRIRTIVAHTEVDNVASQRVLEANGFVRSDMLAATCSLRWTYRVRGGK